MENKKIVLGLFVCVAVFLYTLSGCSSVNGQGGYIPEDAVVIEASVAEVYNNANAIVTIISDDGDWITGNNLYALCRGRGIKCTVAGIISEVDPSIDKWKEFVEEGSVELVSHSYNHIKMDEGSEISMDVEALRYEIVEADRYLEDALGYEQIVFVCPENCMCSNGYLVLEDNNFWAVRRGTRGFNSLSPKNGQESGQWYNLMVQGIGDADVDTIIRNSWVDTVIQDRAWLIEMWHNVRTVDDGLYQTLLLEDAKTHLDYIAKKSQTSDIWVANFTEATKYIREKQNSNVVAYYYNGQINVYIELTDESMDYNTFNQELTVIISINDAAIAEELKKTVNMIDGNSFIINVVPGKKTVIDVSGV